jgi:hypothetical protein
MMRISNIVERKTEWKGGWKKGSLVKNTGKLTRKENKRKTNKLRMS